MRLFLGTFVQLHDYISLKHHFSFIQGKWSKKNNLHITLLFLGEVKEPSFIIEKLQGIEYPKDPIPIGGLGYFGTPPKILYAKAHSNILQRLHNTICRRLDFTEDAPFLPHVTLCRINAIKDKERFLRQLRMLENKNFGLVSPKLQLIKSTLTPKGPIYEPIASF